MSLININNEDDDYNSFSSSTNTDDDIVDLNYHTHRTCSRYGLCNNKTHQHSSINLTTSKCLSNNSNLFKGKIRSIDDISKHRQKYDGTKWRRICSISDCYLYLNGGVYYENWLCRKHYLNHISRDTSTVSDNSIIDDTAMITSTNEKSRRSPIRHTKKNITPKRGDLMVDADGIHQKYNGKLWRPICNYNNCKSYIVARGYCHRHDMQIREKKSEVLSSLNDPSQSNSVTKPHIKQSTISSVSKPKKGDIQCVRQLWNGRKWYSLCQYHTQDCTRRSGGIKHASLCDKHYKEYIKQKKNLNLIRKNRLNSLSPTVKRKRSINYDNISVTNIMDRSYQCQSTITQTKHTEQFIQTDVTYPLESKDLREGCFLIDDDDMDDQYQSESSQLMVYIKKEENCLSDKRKLPIDANTLPINCKLEITKLEF